MNKLRLFGSTLFASSLLAASAHADYTGYLSLKSSTDATWDTSTATWKMDGSDLLRTYANGSNVVIGPDFTGSLVSFGAWLQPGYVVFDSASDIVLGPAQNNNGLGGNTRSLSKRGSGKLTVQNGWNGNKCPWHVYAGILSSEDKSTSANTTPFGSFSNYEPTIYVHDGAALENPSSTMLGAKTDTAEAEDKCVNVVVYTNGVFRPGITGSYQYPYSAVRDLILAIDTYNLDEDLLVVAADNILDFSFLGFVEAFKEKGIEAHGFVCDVNDEAQVKAMIEKIEQEVGTVDILVNNAGIIRRIPMHEMELEEFRLVVDTDLTAPFIVSKAVIPGMIRKGHGKIINICSMMSELGRETVSAYAAAKGGLKMLTRNIASEYGEYNIQCNGIGPGYIATSQTAPLREPQPDGSRHPFDSFIVSKTPAARWGTPEDLKGPVVFLASDASNFVNGHILYVDGGILAYIGKQPK